MSTSISKLSRLVVLLLVLGFAALTAAVALSQAPGQKPPPKEEEEDPNAKPAKPKPKVPGEEEEDPNFKPKKTKVIRVGDENMETTSVKPSANAAPVIDLMTAYRNAKVPAFKKFFFDIAEPHDIITTRGGGGVTVGGVAPAGTHRVRPLEEYLDQEKPRFTGRLSLWRFKDSEWLLEKDSWDVPASTIARIQYYEQTVVKAVDNFVDPRNPSEEKLRAAQTALIATLRFHESAREQGKRRGDGFVPMIATVREKLLRVNLDQMELYVKANKWDDAVELAAILATTFNRPEDQPRIVGPLANAIKSAIHADATDDQLQGLLRRAKQLELLFPGNNASNPIQVEFRKQAQGYFDTAKSLVKTDPPKALLFAKRAEEMFPRLAELRDFRLGLENKLSELRVGVRELPRHLTPGLAFLDSEKQAVELMFESLIELGADSNGNPRWLPGLAQGPPKLVPLGRQFQIGREAYWSNDKPITSADVQNTVRLLRNPKWPGHSSAWANLVEDMVGGDPTKVTMTLRQGYLDPLSLMNFKVLPAEPWPDKGLLPGLDQEFDQNPVGSGPYMLHQRKGTHKGREVVSFTANPAYASRPGKFGLPGIRGVRFFKCGEPLSDLQKNNLDLVIDLPNRDVASVKAIPRVTVTSYPNRRVYFLAVNHRQPKLQNNDLRVALAHAINREKILTDVFRHNLEPKPHKALNGPFPAGCWAANPEEVFRPELAKISIKAAEDKGLKNVKLSLKYPEDSEIRGAMEEIAKHVQDEIGVTLELQALSPHSLHNDVEVLHKYELAYYWYDFPDPTYWMWPMFDPLATGSGGTNYLGYQNDGAMEAQFANIMSWRQFGEVKKLTYLLHRMMHEKMPLIPLWQLDTHIVMDKDLHATISDPLLVFTDVDQWRFDKK